MKKLLMIMGVSGSGKSTLASELSSKYKVEFIEADDFHTLENKNKMNQGIPLTDQDRFPWLQNIKKYIHDMEASKIVLACSALKRSYRQILNEENDMLTLFLDLDSELLNDRLIARKNHFAKASLLQSQLDALEKPDVKVEKAVIIKVHKEDTIDLLIEKCYQILNKQAFF